ncbi:MAG: twin-arginine translocase subunit TatC, partial [Gammaproteobacteria bacterium]
TPPDVISQILLAVPMWLLYELGIIFSRMVRPGERKEDEEAPGDEGHQIHPAPAAAASAAGHAAAPSTDSAVTDPDDDEYRPLSEEEMEAELDYLEIVEDEEDDEAGDAPASDADDDSTDDTDQPDDAEDPDSPPPDRG